MKIETSKGSLLQRNLDNYIRDTNNFLLNHTNSEIFSAIFTNFTHYNGEILYEQYLNQRQADKSLSKEIEAMNSDITSNAKEKWEYDPQYNKYILPKDSTIY